MSAANQSINSGVVSNSPDVDFYFFIFDPGKNFKIEMRAALSDFLIANKSIEIIIILKRS